MTLRLDPRYPVVWRSPDTIQVGIDRPLVVLSAVADGLERVISALFVGIPHSGALMLGRKGGASDEDILALLHALAPVLLVTGESRPADEIAGESVPGSVPGSAPAREPAPPAIVPGPVFVGGNGPTAERIKRLLEDLGFRVTERADNDGAALAVEVAHFALEPDRHGRWLRRDIPHLPVVFSDCQVRIGPLVEPGTGACLSCLELAHIDADPAWPAIACQLLTRRAPTETPRQSIDVSTRVAGLVHDRLASGRSVLTGTSLVIDAENSLLRRRVHQPHERCGCLSVPGSLSASTALGADRL
ncbi:hypothetical protein E3T37_13325 [Cryobacterium sp. TMT2-10]|uniref:hypothetical protein n=1 Tax=Cryobacterium sp. TMT2-10 TaxID=1259244 RepID=UPI00106B1A75|nr:hypothetical protein [Cryobacterium sp. TMT2-10]TFD36898.1 hypothetical protein E3T37_13325 [Cryobacterium sp. TMT2-10]